MVELSKIDGSPYVAPGKRHRLPALKIAARFDLLGVEPVNFAALDHQLGHETFAMKPNGYIISLLTAACFNVTLLTSRASGPGKRIPVTTESLNNTHQLIGPLGRPVGEVFTVDLKVTEA